MTKNKNEYTKEEKNHFKLRWGKCLLYLDTITTTSLKYDHIIYFCVLIGCETDSNGNVIGTHPYARCATSHRKMLCLGQR